MKKLLFTVLLLWCGNSLLAQDQLVLNSEKLSRPDTVWVFKPAAYNTKRIWPVVYMLHGYSGSYKQWNSIIGAQKYADEYGCIIVCPDGLFNSWYFNSPVNPKSQYQDFFFNELFPAIRSAYKEDPNNIFITGLSMGGHGALFLFSQKPELFRAAGSTSGVTDLSSSTVKYGLASLLGNPPDSSRVWKDFSVVGNLDRIKASGKPILFDCGTEDAFYKVNNELRDKCDELKINATYIAQPGAHNRAYWAKSARQHFNFFKSVMDATN
jgi:putative tributyrin esterase